jgi:hypothetical protein
LGEFDSDAKRGEQSAQPSMLAGSGCQAQRQAQGLGWDGSASSCVQYTIFLQVTIKTGFKTSVRDVYFFRDCDFIP